ncbi:PREDICTED: F-box [Prunus dulcis]|uniref:PREDICTED: F-box n=1 Tax=Prunus dulcis TaxID=3755 RepID=A0A5E4G6F5_PRUDU|nr:PREDICTED: F-box [Prunus dulcis]
MHVSWSSLIRSPSFVAACHNFRWNDSNKSITNFLFEKEKQRAKKKEKLRPRSSKHVFFSSKIEQQGCIPTRVAKFSCKNLRKAFGFGHPHDVQNVWGLVCLSSPHGPVFMLNPSTRECTKLPLNEIKIEGYWPGFATYHFGYSPLSNEYKVLQFLYLHSKGLGKCHVGFNIITLGTSSWRPLQVDNGHLPFDALAYASVSYRRRSSGSVCLNGAVHWIYEKQKVIVAFDVRKETFRVMPLLQDYSQEFDDCDDKDNYHFYGSIANSYCRESAVVVEVGGMLGCVC